MTGSAVLDTVVGLVGVYYALALLCSGAVEMIANWVKKRSKYLLRGLHDLIGEAGQTAGSGRQGRLKASVGEIRANRAEELQRYDATLQATRPGARTTPQAAISITDIMGHALVQPLRHASALGKPTRNPAYLPAGVFSATLLDLLVPASAGDEVTPAELRTGIRRAHRFDETPGVPGRAPEVGGRRRAALPRRDREVVRGPDGPGGRILQALGEAMDHRHRGRRRRVRQHRHRGPRAVPVRGRGRSRRDHPAGRRPRHLRSRGRPGDVREEGPGAPAEQRPADGLVPRGTAGRLRQPDGAAAQGARAPRLGRCGGTGRPLLVPGAEPVGHPAQHRRQGRQRASSTRSRAPGAACG